MKTKIPLIIISVLLFSGLLIIASLLAKNSRIFSEISELQINTHTVTEDFDSFYIKTDVADLEFMVSDNNICKVECREEKDFPHSVRMENNTLFITCKEKKLFDFSLINFSSVKITVYLPKDEYSALTVSGSTGNITVPENLVFANSDISITTGDVNFCASVSKNANITSTTGNIAVSGTNADNLNISLTTGKISVFDAEIKENLTANVKTGKCTLNNVTCNGLTSTGTTGEIALTDVCSKGNFSVKRTTGNITLSGCDGKNISLTATTGDITGALNSPKTFETQSNTGKISVPSYPESSANGICSISTGTGDINISVKN